MKKEDLKDREDRYDRGVTRKEILKYILNFADGIEEPKIRGYLRDEFNISAMRNIKTHLEKLENEGYIIKKSSPGEANIWTINYDNFDLISSFIAREIIQYDMEYKKEEILTLFNAKGTQKFILYHLSIKEYPDSIWELIFRSHIFNEMLDPPTPYDPFIRYFCELISLSPSLYCSFFSNSGTFIDIAAGMVFDSVQIEFDDQNIYKHIRPFVYKVLAPCVIDAIKYPSQKPMISEFLYGFDKFYFKDTDKFVIHPIYRTLLDRYEKLNSELTDALELIKSLSPSS